MRQYVYLFVYLLVATGMYAQPTHNLSGIVLDENGDPLPGAHIVLERTNLHSISDTSGKFIFHGLKSGIYELKASYVGYKASKQNIEVPEYEKPLTIVLHPDYTELQEIIVENRYGERRKQETSQAVEVVDHEFIKQNLAGSLMKSLDKIPGISTIDIGGSQSKPVIRGLGFNRVVVIDEGIKHQAQQWGVDHGLEVDQYAVERVEVLKGPASLLHGSDAIGGIIDLQDAFIPAEDHIGGNIDLTGKTNNQLAGGSVQLHGRKEKVFAKARFTYLDYGDYSIPTDQVRINTYNIDLHDNQLRNTAGHERNMHFTAGYVHDRVNTRLSVGYLHTKNGFFANAHGLEVVTADSTFDSSSRDIDLPFQEVDHVKVVHKTKIYGDNGKLETDIGFQKNMREEHNRYIQHGFRPPALPEHLQELGSFERGFDKNTFSTNVRGYFHPLPVHQMVAGVNLEKQDNVINGYGFVIPSFKSMNGGLFLYDKMKLSGGLMVHAGVRYDLGKVITQRYTDWYETPILDEGTGDTLSTRAIERSPDMEKMFANYSWSAGLNYNRSSFQYKVNIGKSFRVPTPQELAANGINYHMYRYEAGDSSLEAEVSYQLDMGMDAEMGAWSVNMSPFINYFPNYLFLNPTSGFREGMQVYHYTQSEVLRYGGELRVGYEPVKWFETVATGEYLFARQLSGTKKGFTLPFSPPPAVHTEVIIKPGDWLIFEEPVFNVQWQFTAKQDQIVPPEEVTPAYNVVHLGLHTHVLIGKQMVRLNFQVKNVLDKAYLDHTSYYRLNEIPEPGRNVVLNIKIPIEH